MWLATSKAETHPTYSIPSRDFASGNVRTIYASPRAPPLFFSMPSIALADSLFVRFGRLESRTSCFLPALPPRGVPAEMLP